MVRISNWVSILASATITLGVSLRFDDGTKNDFAEIDQWFSSHPGIDYESHDQITPKELLKAGVARIRDTNTFIIPDGDLVDLTSYEGLKAHHGDYYHFAEYDMNNMKPHKESIEKTLGTGLDNRKSSVANKVSYSVSISRDTAVTLYGDYAITIGPANSANYLEIDPSISRSQSKEISCDVLPGKVSYVKTVANLVVYGNIKKRPIGIEVGKRNYYVGQHSYSLEYKDWQVTELELVEDLSLLCLDVDLALT